ncbi:hypothetical protein EVG20_g1444 [Dentipellis fragilis]|uniref:Peptidase A1 domain-containing protein n=1 Tax=Dentipellis fragilis TaxID=205917 RepID=A0A4Y9ZBP4_9AGAM|nr:hypothetical protein EVG20_g1444 [Dentipellis fragilis]
MRYTVTFDALLAAVSLVLSAPVSVRAIPFPHDHEFPASHVNLSEISHLPANVSRRAAPPLTIPLVPFGNHGLDQGYTALVKVGTNPVAFKVLMDSGSSEFWLISDKCPQRGRRNVIGPSTSQTVRPFGRQWSTGYEDKSTLAGAVVTDTVIVADRTLRGIPFGTADTLTNSLVNSPYDGIMGFGFSSVSQTGGPTILEALSITGLIPAAISGWKLSRSADHGNDGEVSLGGENLARFFQEKQVFVPNLSGGVSKHWQFDIDGISFNGRRVTPGRIGVVDTGTDALYAHPVDALTVNSLISGVVRLQDGSFAFPCNARPKLSITINKVAFDIDPRDITGPPVINGFCQSNILPDPTRQPGEWLIGIPFLKNVYLTLDVRRDRMGFAKLR